MIDSLKKLFPTWLKRFIKMQLHRGDNFECPICHFRAKDFGMVGIDIPVIKEKKIIGGGQRKAACFKCDSDDRERLVYLYLRDKLEIFQKGEYQILHIAPEKNLAKKLWKANFRRYECGDLFQGSYKYPRFVKNMDVTNLSFEDDSFDLVICNHVLEHVENDRKAMLEIARVLKDEGIAILQVPISETEPTFEDSSVKDPKDRTRMFGQPDHVRIYGQDYTKRLEENGFRVDRVNISEDHPNHGLNPKEDLFICKIQNS